MWPRNQGKKKTETGRVRETLFYCSRTEGPWVSPRHRQMITTGTTNTWEMAGAGNPETDTLPTQPNPQRDEPRAWMVAPFFIPISQGSSPPGTSLAWPGTVVGVGWWEVIQKLTPEIQGSLREGKCSQRQRVPTPEAWDRKSKQTCSVLINVFFSFQDDNMAGTWS